MLQITASLGLHFLLCVYASVSLICPVCFEPQSCRISLPSAEITVHRHHVFCSSGHWVFCWLSAIPGPQFHLEQIINRLCSNPPPGLSTLGVQESVGSKLGLSMCVKPIVSLRETYSLLTRTARPVTVTYPLTQLPQHWTTGTIPCAWPGFLCGC